MDKSIAEIELATYLQERGVKDTEAVREELSEWFDQWIRENPDYQKRVAKEE